MICFQKKSFLLNLTGFSSEEIPVITKERCDSEPGSTADYYVRGNVRTTTCQRVRFSTSSVVVGQSAV